MTKRSFNIIYMVLFVVITFFLIWKCQYGYGQYDEGFYLDFTYRFAQGDILLIDEWHPAQLFSFVLLPIMKIYLLIFRTTEGVMLNWRYLTIAIQGLLALFVYRRYSNESRWGALIASLLLYVFIPFGITALSYNSLAIILLTACCTLFVTTCETREFSRVIAGALFAAAVLCCPHLVIAYLVYGGACIVTFLINSSKSEKIANIKECFSYNKGSNYFLRFRVFLEFTFGIAIIAGIFVSYLLMNGEIKDYVDNLKVILSEPGHKRMVFFRCIWNYFSSIMLHSSKIKVWTIIAYSILGIDLICMIFDKKRNIRKNFYLMSFTVICFFSIIAYWVIDRCINFQLYPLAICGIAFYIYCCDNDMASKCFKMIWIPGMLYSFCINLSSNTHFYAISSASIVPTVGSILIFAVFAKETMSFKDKVDRIIVTLNKAIIVLTFISVFILRYQQLFWEGDMSEQTERILFGPQKGILVSSEKKSLYEGLLSETEILHSNPKIRNVAYLTKATWMYLTGEERAGIYGSCLSYGVDNFDIYEKYYQMHLDKIPDAVYIENEYEDTADFFVKNYQFEIVNDGTYGQLLLRDTSD